MKGLEQLRIIVLRPLPSAETVEDNNSPDDLSELDDEQKERLDCFASLYGSVGLNKTLEEADAKIEKMREGWK